MRRLKKDGEKMVSEDGPRELVKRLKKDGEKMVSEDGQRVGEEADDGWREDGQ